MSIMGLQLSLLGLFRGFPRDYSICDFLLPFVCSFSYCLCFYFYQLWFYACLSLLLQFRIFELGTIYLVWVFSCFAICAFIFSCIFLAHLFLLMFCFWTNCELLLKVLNNQIWNFIDSVKHKLIRLSMFKSLLNIQNLNFIWILLFLCL